MALKEGLKALEKIVDTLIARDDSGPFREPVDWKGLGLWDYCDVVTEMMDLGTVKAQLISNQYKTLNRAAGDVRLVFHNCMLYNEQGSDFHSLAESFEERFEGMYAKVEKAFGKKDEGGGGVEGWAKGGKGGNNMFQTTNTGKAPTLEAKKSFSQSLFKITGDELGHVVTVLDQKCPRSLTAVKALKDNTQTNGATADEPNVEVVVDLIDKNTFWELKEFVDRKIERRSMGNKRKR